LLQHFRLANRRKILSQRSLPMIIARGDLQVLNTKSLRGGRSRARTADLLLVRQRHQFHSLHDNSDFPWPYINSGNLLSLKVEPVLVVQLGISTQF
jgi:hypothetical protein